MKKLCLAILLSLFSSLSVQAALIQDTLEITVTEVLGQWIDSDLIEAGDVFTLTAIYDDEGTFFTFYEDGDNGLVDFGGDDVVTQNFAGSGDIASDAVFNLSGLLNLALSIEAELGLIPINFFPFGFSYFTDTAPGTSYSYTDDNTLFVLNDTIIASFKVFGRTYSEQLGEGFSLERVDGFNFALTSRTSAPVDVPAPASLGMFALALLAMRRFRKR